MFNFYLKQRGALSLKEAAEIYGYTQHHFGLLCRQGKLKSERIGKRWFTTQKWADEYLEGLKGQYKTNNYTRTDGFLSRLIHNVKQFKVAGGGLYGTIARRLFKKRIFGFQLRA